MSYFFNTDLLMNTMKKVLSEDLDALESGHESKVMSCYPSIRFFALLNSSSVKWPFENSSERVANSEATF